jgi:hypothetical protein
MPAAPRGAAVTTIPGAYDPDHVNVLGCVGS